jgi:hypothetical protein
MFEYNIITVMGDSPTQECDPSPMMVPYGIGLVSLLVPILYEYAGGFKAKNSSLVRGGRYN